MSDALISSPESYLVFGGSEGIGFEFARYHSRRKASITLVARDDANLRRRRDQLLEEGAREVEIRIGDLLDTTFRQNLLAGLAGGFKEAFVGGPSPSPGHFSDLNGEDFRRAFDIVLGYPLDIVRWGLRSGLSTGGRLIVLSSSSTEEPLCEHGFFLSALLRRTLDQVLDCLKQDYARRGLSIAVWKPKVVMTRLASRYAKQNCKEADEETLNAFLRKSFGVDVIPTAEQWINEMMDRS